MSRQPANQVSIQSHLLSAEDRFPNNPRLPLQLVEHVAPEWADEFFWRAAARQTGPIADDHVT